MGNCVSSQNGDSRRLHADAEHQLKKVCLTQNTTVILSRHCHFGPSVYTLTVISVNLSGQTPNEEAGKGTTIRLFQGCKAWNPLDRQNEAHGPDVYFQILLLGSGDSGEYRGNQRRRLQLVWDTPLIAHPKFVRHCRFQTHNHNAHCIRLLPFSQAKRR